MFRFRLGWALAIAGAWVIGSVQSSSFAAMVPVASFSLPAPSNVSFSTSATFGPDGLIYAYDGLNVFKQNALNSGSFTQINTGTAGVAGSDAGPITFTSDGQKIVVSTATGGFDFSGNSNGLFQTLPAAGGAFSSPFNAKLANTFAFKPLQSSTVTNAANKLAVNFGNGDFGNPVTAVAYYDLTDAGAGSMTASKTVIGNIPGASTDVAFDGAGFYVGIGFGTNAGDIRRFDVSDLDNAYNTNTPLAFSDGALINPGNGGDNSGAGIFVADGSVFAGSGSGGGLVVIGPDGNSKVYNLGKGFAAIFYNPTNDEFAVTDFDGSVDVFKAIDFIPEPACIAIAGFVSLALLRRRGRRCA
jgi:hypothetical protein